MLPPDVSGGARVDPGEGGVGLGLECELGPLDFEALAAGDVVVRADWLGSALARAVHAEAMERLSGVGALSTTGVGRGRGWRPGEGVRGDEILWIDPAPAAERAAGGAPSALAALLQRLDLLRRALSLGLRIGLARTELQLARYSRPGSGYLPHRDALRGGTRRMTAVYYLNPDWKPEHGGVLRAHLAGSRRDIEPRLDHLVLFAAEQVEHEVLPVFHPRLALTAWFGREDPLGRLR